MHIKIFMSSANNVQERQILKDFGIGIEKWIRENSNQELNFKNITRIGRWNDIDLVKNNLLSYEYSEYYTECDVAVIFGSWKPREKGSHITRNSVVTGAKKFICIETPLLTRKTDTVNTHWRVGVGGFLNQSADWPKLSKEEAVLRLKNLQVSWSGWKHDPDGHILLALQLPGDASLRGIDINEWGVATVNGIRQYTDRPITIRNHPLMSNRSFNGLENLLEKLLLSDIENIRFSDGSSVPWKKDLKNAYCTVTYTSGLAIDSVIAGIPTIACDPGNFAWGISSNDISDIDQLKLANEKEIQTWLENLSGCQWSSVEMRSGVAWQHLLPLV